MKTDCIHYEICKEAKWCEYRNRDKECEYYLPLNAPTQYVVANAADYYAAEVLNELLPYEKLKAIQEAAEFTCAPLGSVILMTRNIWHLSQSKKEKPTNGKLEV